MKLDQPVRAPGTSDAPASFAVALHFEQHAHSVSNGNGHRREPERRRSPRRVLALPVRVRPGRVPWFEEAMAIDFSTHGMLQIRLPRLGPAAANFALWLCAWLLFPTASPST